MVNLYDHASLFEYLSEDTRLKGLVQLKDTARGLPVTVVSTTDEEHSADFVEDDSSY